MSPLERVAQNLTSVRWTGERFTALCPAHADRNRSLSGGVGGDRKAILKCHAGCTIESIVTALGLEMSDLFNGSNRIPTGPQSGAPDRTQQIRRRLAAAITDTGRVAAYLRDRGLSGMVPSALRLGPEYPYYENRERLETYPAMVAGIERLDGTVVGMHCTYLAADGAGKAPVPSPKKVQTIGDGASRGAAVQLAEATDVLALTEGIETALAVMEATGVPAWAAVSAGHLGVVDVPPSTNQIEIWGDHDVSGAGQRAAEACAARLHAAGHVVLVLVPPAPGDWLDVLVQQGRDALRQVRATATIWTPSAAPRVRTLTVLELLALDIPPRAPLLAPILREKETAMLHAWRGVGKTHMGLEIAFAVASGGGFLRWTAPQPRRVLYLDGEMPGRTMQERLAAIVQASPRADAFEPGNLRFVCADLLDDPLPSLSTPAGQVLLEPLVAEVDLIVVDSISTLAGGGKENEAESWLPMQAWALALRRRGKTVLLLHHDGKGGQQRGTSRKEDILDVVIHLRRPGDYEPQQGARFEVHYEKARGLHGEDVEPFEAALVVSEDGHRWTVRPLDDAQLARAEALYNDGCKPADVAQELGISRATAYRLRRRLEEAGTVSPSQTLGRETVRQRPKK